MVGDFSASLSIQDRTTERSKSKQKKKKTIDQLDLTDICKTLNQPRQNIHFSQVYMGYNPGYTIC